MLLGTLSGLKVLARPRQSDVTQLIAFELHHVKGHL